MDGWDEGFCRKKSKCTDRSFEGMNSEKEDIKNEKQLNWVTNLMQREYTFGKILILAAKLILVVLEIAKRDVSY